MATALELSQQAVAEDREFASAQIFLAWMLHNTGAPSKTYLELAERALSLSSRATETERLFILGSYHELSGDRAKAEAAYAALLQLQPDHYWATNNLTGNLFQQGRTHDALKYVMQIADVRPNDPVLNYRAAEQIARLMGDRTRAQPYARRVLATSLPDFPSVFAWALCYDAAEQFFARNPRGVADELTRILAHPSATAGATGDWIKSKAVRYALAIGQRHRASTIADGIVDQSFLRPFYRSLVALAGDDAAALREHAVKIPFNDYANVTVWLLLRAGLHDRAEALPRLEPPPMRRGGVLALTRGSIAAARGDFDTAIPALKEALARRVPGNHARVSRDLAEVYVQQGSPADAIAVLETSWAFDPPSDIDIDGPYLHDWMPNALLLAKLYRDSGRTVQAEKIEAELRQLLALADPDFPALQQLQR